MLLQFLKESVSETLWPTRCAICDTPGTVLCESCLKALPYIDYWRACPRCASPFGKIQCTECNPITRAHSENEAFSFDHLRSLVVYSNESARIVRTYKDSGEQRLAAMMAECMARLISPESPARSPSGLVTYIPATKRALRRRGFDHAELLARCVASELELPFEMLLMHPLNKDQRTLGRTGRISNMQGRFSCRAEAHSGSAILLVDDVCTTGSTLDAAAICLKQAGVGYIECLTFARVW